MEWTVSHHFEGNRMLTSKPQRTTVTSMAYCCDMPSRWYHKPTNAMMANAIWEWRNAS